MLFNGEMLHSENIYFFIYSIAGLETLTILKRQTYVAQRIADVIFDTKDIHLKRTALRTIPDCD